MPVIPRPEMTAGRDLTAERNARVIPAARELIAAMACLEDLPIGVVNGQENEKAAKYYQELYKNLVVPLLLKHDLKLNEVSYMFQIMIQPIDLLKSVVNASLSMNRDLTDAKLYEISDIDELRVSDIDRILRVPNSEEDSKEDGIDKSVDIVDKS